MKIITVNLPLSYLKAIDSLTGHDGLYPSRSELIRVATRDFLIREIDAAKEFMKFTQNQQAQKQNPPSINNDLFVRVPIGSGEDGLPQEYKTYTLVKR